MSSPVLADKKVLHMFLNGFVENVTTVLIVDFNGINLNVTEFNYRF